MLTEALGLIASLSFTGFVIVLHNNFVLSRKNRKIEEVNGQLISSSDDWQRRYNISIQRIKDLECEKSSMMTRMMVNSSINDSGNMVQDSSHIQ